MTSESAESSLILASSRVFCIRWIWLLRSRTNCLRAREPVAHLLGLFVRHEAASDQPMGHQIGQPGGVVDVGLAARHVLDMGRVRQHQLELAVTQNMPTGFQ